MHRYTYKEKEKNMKDKIFGVLQRVGRSFMLPIAILPVAGLLLGLGSSFTNATTIATYGLQGILGEGTILHSLLIIMNKVGSAIFDNLPLIFAVGVAIGMAKKEKEVAALSALIAYFVMHISINSMLEISGKQTFHENSGNCRKTICGTRYCTRARMCEKRKRSTGRKPVHCDLGARPPRDLKRPGGL